MIENAKSIEEILGVALILIGASVAILACVTFSLMLLIFKFSWQEKLKIGMTLTVLIGYLVATGWIYFNRPEILLTAGSLGIVPICCMSWLVHIFPKDKENIEGGLRKFRQSKSGSPRNSRNKSQTE